MLEKLEDLAPWYTPKQAGEILGLRRDEVVNLCTDGELTHRVTTGPGGQRRYKISHLWLAAYVEAHTVRRSKRKPAA